MTEVIAMLKEESHPLRVPNATAMPPPPDGIPTESAQVAELTLEAQDAREELLEVMEDNDLGKTSLKVEPLCALLDPRRTALGADQLMDGSAALRTRAEENLKGVRLSSLRMDRHSRPRLCRRQCWTWSPRNLHPRRRDFRD